MKHFDELPGEMFVNPDTTLRDRLAGDDEYDNPIKKEIRDTHQTQFNQRHKSGKTKHSNIRVNIPRR